MDTFLPALIEIVLSVWKYTESLQKDVQINASQWVQKISVGPGELEKKNEQYKNGKVITPTCMPM